VATNQDFAYIHQDIDELKKLQANKTASLNENEELKQAEQAALRQKAREAERAGRKAPDEKIYEITVENAGKPGMPPMLWPTNMVSPITNTAAVSPPAAGLAKATRATTMAANAFGTNAPPTDAWLDEAEHILQDYVSLMNKHRLTATNQ
jgi:Tfp pilus assembly protein PilV